MDDVVAVYRRAAEGFGSLVRQVEASQWGRSTPCADWDVRALVHHVVNEDAWAPPLLAGRTIAEVGDSLDGDLLGDDPVSAWDDRIGAALAAAGEDGVLDRVVHVSFGDISGREYLSQMATDHVIHGWDLARGIGAPDDLDPDLVEWTWGFIEPQADAWRAAGVFGPRVEVPDGASLQVRLLALLGRTA
ncbi:MAG TPA: TIGR03086 family metal-binding protein [Acidimicrobiales bacterium]|nr:TIGR03086 family metal-binding protein [Acidimicrobiales bacterium]